MARVAFVSSMVGFPWGGSEVLWSCASLKLKEGGHHVFASVHGWPSTPEPVHQLRQSGVIVHERKAVTESLPGRVANAIRRRIDPAHWAPPEILQAKAALVDFAPDLVCISQGGITDGVPWMEFCMENKLTFVTLAQANAEWCWPNDWAAARLIAAHQAASLCCFVSEANQRLFELQIACRLSNSRVVWNPTQVSREAAPNWPKENESWRLACVGRLAFEKGQDLILQTLALPKWRERAITVSFFGSGPQRDSFQRLAAMLEVDDKVRFEGQIADVEGIWKNHHALFLPSRCEGLPLALVEAMLCARPAIVTAVAGNPEVVEDGKTGFLATAPTLPLVEEALERAWQRRSEWWQIGVTAAQSIRKKLPNCPEQDFANLLLSVATVKVSQMP